MNKLRNIWYILTFKMQDSKAERLLKLLKGMIEYVYCLYIYNFNKNDKLSFFFK